MQGVYLLPHYKVAGFAPPAGVTIMMGSAWRHFSALFRHVLKQHGIPKGRASLFYFCLSSVYQSKLSWGVERDVEVALDSHPIHELCGDEVLLPASALASGAISPLAARRCRRGMCGHTIALVRGCTVYTKRLELGNACLCDILGDLKTSPADLMPLPKPRRGWVLQ